MDEGQRERTKMGEDAKQQEQEPSKVEVPQKAEKEKREDANKPPQPVVLFVDLHCVGCAKKIERSIMGIKGVEGLIMDMAQNQVTIRGGQLDPQAICDRITKKTRRRAEVLSPLPTPPPPPGNEKPSIPAAVDPPVSAPPTKTVELHVYMHCDACADQLKRKILKMEGVEKVETELECGKVTVTGTMNTDKLVEYVYRRTKKQVQIVPRPEPKPESRNQEQGGDQNKKKDGEGKLAEDAGQGKEEEQKKEKDDNGDKKDEDSKEKKGGQKQEEVVELDAEDVMKRTMGGYYYQYQQQPLYVMERMPPPPQLFSDENPHACSIS